MPITILQADITRVPADAVVNAANGRLSVGTGVCGAIHEAGGPSIGAACTKHVEKHGLVMRGDAVATTAGRLRARYVIHAVGPIWRDGRSGESQDLASAYRRSIEVADRLRLRSIVFPSISTGVYGYPVQFAAPVAVAAVSDALGRARHVRTATFALIDEGTFRSYESALAALGGP